MAGIEIESAAPEAVYAAVAAMAEPEFERLMAERRTREIVIGALVEHLVSLFRPEQAGELEATIQIKLWDRPGGGYDHFELRIGDGRCALSDDPGTDPDLTLKVRPSDLRKLVAGETGARRLVFKGRLRVIGDIGLGMRLPDLFGF